MDNKTLRQKVLDITSAYRYRDSVLESFAESGEGMLRYANAMQVYLNDKEQLKGMVKQKDYAEIMFAHREKLEKAREGAVKAIKYYNQKAIEAGLEPIMKKGDLIPVVCVDYARDYIEAVRENALEFEEMHEISGQEVDNSLSTKDIKEKIIKEDEEKQWHEKREMLKGTFSNERGDVDYQAIEEEYDDMHASEHYGLEYVVVNLQPYDLSETTPAITDKDGNIIQDEILGQKDLMLGKGNGHKVKEIHYPGPIRSADDVVKFLKENHADAVMGNLPINIQSSIIKAMNEDKETKDIPYLASKTERVLVQETPETEPTYQFKATDVYQIDKCEYKSKVYEPTNEQKKVALILRHQMSPEQLEALGPNIITEQFKDTIESAQDLKDKTKDCDMLMVVCPPDMLQDFVQMADGRPVLKAIMGKNPETGRFDVFKKYEQIDEMDVQTHSVKDTGELLAKRADRFVTMATEKLATGRYSDGSPMVNENEVAEFFANHPDQKMEIAMYSQDAYTQMIAGIETSFKQDSAQDIANEQSHKYVQENEEHNDEIY